MQVTTRKQAEALNRLAAIVDYDIDLVQRAIRANSDDGKPAPLSKVVRYLVDARNAKREAEAARLPSP